MKVTPTEVRNGNRGVRRYGRQAAEPAYLSFYAEKYPSFNEFYNPGTVFLPTRPNARETCMAWAAEPDVQHSASSELLRFSDVPPPPRPRYTSPLILPGRKWMTCASERMSFVPFPSKSLTAANSSLEALSSYIQSQRELLSRTQSEIERLHALKKEVKDEEDFTVDDINQKVRLLAGFCKAIMDRPVYSSMTAFLDSMRRQD